MPSSMTDTSAYAARKATPSLHRATLLAFICLTLLSAVRPAAAQLPFNPVGDDQSWPVWGGNLQNTHSTFAEDAPNVYNVSQLTQKWVFQTAGDVSATPTADRNSVYVPDWGGFLYRIDAQTGKAVWSHKVSEYTGIATSLSRNSPALGHNQLVFGDQASGTVMSVDKNSGSLLWKTVLDASIGAIITNSPVIVGDRVYVGVASLQEGLAVRPGFVLTFRGSIAALDLNTGKLLWQTYTVPTGYTGGSVWGSSFAVDFKRNSLYVTSGNNYSVPAPVTACIANAGVDATAKVACLDPADYIDAVLSLDLATGKVKWSRRLEGADTWTVSCIISGTGGIPCPDQAGPDYDFGSGPNLFRAPIHERWTDVLGAGQKSGVYWALNPDDGSVFWETQVGPGGALGGIEWGSAVDFERVYVALNNSNRFSYLLQPGNTQSWSAGSWAALNTRTGAFEWQVPVTGQDPLKPTQAAGAVGQLTAANGVVYAGSLSGDMVALNGSTGAVLWKFASGGSVIDGPSLVNGTLYWGSGYKTFNIGTGNNKLYAFSLPSSAGWR